MDENEFNKQLIDRFEGYELVELLGITADEIVADYKDTIEEHRDFLEDYLLHGR